MQYTHAVNLMSGEVITVSEKQAVAIKEALLNGAEWIPIGNELINAKSVAKVGYHHDTANAQKRLDSTNEMVMIAEGKGQLVDERRKLAQKLAIENAIKANKQEYARLEGKSLPMSCEQEEKGSPQFYLNEFGEKMYN